MTNPYFFLSSDRRWLSSEWSNKSTRTFVHPIPARIETRAELNNNNNNNNNNNHRAAPKVEAIVLKEELIRICPLITVYIIPLVLSTTIIIPRKSHESLKLLNLAPAVYVIMQKAVILSTCSIVRKFLAEQ
jgi:hypothetical protein